MVKIGSFKISLDNHPMIVAEMSGNHNQSLERARAIVDAAASAGVDALKLQTYTPDTLTLNIRSGDFFIKDKNNIWKGTSLYELYQKAYTPWEWHKEIFDRCRKNGLLVFSSPFDETAVDFLEKLNAPCYKIASFENVHHPLIKKAARTGKPLIMSTGMATLSELAEGVAVARANGCRDLVLLKATSSYPADPKESNLLTIPHLREMFNCEVGLSDHTLGFGVAVASVALGARVIEKHVTVDRKAGGVDSSFSFEPEELKTLVEESKKAWQALGKVNYGPVSGEQSSMIFRRSVYIAADMKAGEKFNRKNLRIVRPGFGLSPKFHEIMLGRKITRAVKKGTASNWDLILGIKNDKKSR